MADAKITRLVPAEGKDPATSYVEVRPPTDGCPNCLIRYNPPWKSGLTEVGTRDAGYVCHYTCKSCGASWWTSWSLLTLGDREPRSPQDQCSKCHRWVEPAGEDLPGVEGTEIVLYGQYDCPCGWGWRMGWAVEDLV